MNQADQKETAPEKVAKEKRDHQWGGQDQEVGIFILGEIITMAPTILSIESIPGPDLDQEKKGNLIDTDLVQERIGDLEEKDLFQEI